MPSVAIVVTFFGRAPMWMPAFLQSCRANPDVNWIIYTDVDVTAGVPSNVAFRLTTLRELSQRSSERLGFKIEVRRPRKLCDLKITYGVIFADDLLGADFWGCSDLDIVWGSVRTFATPLRLRDYDIFSSRKDKLSGHCTLYRNTPELSRLFERIPNYSALLASSHYEHLDERELTKYVRSGLRVYWKEELTTKPDYQKANWDKALWWKNGRTFDAQGRELMYVHFHKWKQDMVNINFGPDDRPGAFMITRTGFTA
jgi:hypothetical protein